MEVERKGIVFVAAKSRMYVSRLFAIVILAVVIFTSHSFAQDSTIDFLFEMTGLFLLTVCCMGRLWALIYISGNKRRELIMDGPYSMVRNPLYFFSLIGAIGIGLVSENLLVLGLILIFYILYYPLTVVAEERKLEETFGEPYIEYKRKTPSFIPKLSLYREPEVYPIKMATFVRSFWFSIWYVWIYILLQFIERGQNLGYWPVLWKIP
jgi:protein-S-isoprenylcysteine O-methyltransferase Ste14